MSEPETPPRPAARRRRSRLSVLALMMTIVPLAVFFAVVSPLYHLGPPPCLTPVKTAVWLVAKPAAATCLDCHGRR